MKEEVFRCGQWVCSITKGADGEVTSFQIANPSPEGNQRYFRVVSGKFGQPTLEVEPHLALLLPSNLTYRSSAGEKLEHSTLEKLGGFIVADEAGAVIHRYSLTNAQNKGINYGFREDGAFMVNGKAYHLRTLFSKDARRIIGYDGYFSAVNPEDVKPDHVRVLELADLTAYFCAP